MLRIQPFNESHTDLVVRAFKEGFHMSEIPYIDEFQNSGFSYVCLDRHNHVQGFALVRKTEDRVTAMSNYELGWLLVALRYRKNGYASRLLEMVKSAIGFASLTLSTQSSNTHNLYSRAGFECEKEPVYVWLPEHTCYHCQKPLSKKEAIKEQIVTNVSMTPYGIKNTYSEEAVCYNCRTRIES